MSKPDKKAAKEQARRLEQLQRQEDQKRMKQQLQKLQEQQEKLRKTSSPLVQFGLLDAYEFFLKHLAQSGIPQGNVFEFAAQSVLKYEKKIKKKEEELKRIQEYNKSVIESQKKAEISPVKKKIIRPNMLPFKGEINRDELNILKKINGKNNRVSQPSEQNQNQYEQDAYEED